MIQTTPPTTPAEQADFWTNLAQQAQSFVDGILTLDPQQAALRGGLSVLVLIGAALIMWSLRLLLKAMAERFSAPAEGDQRRLQVGRWSMRVARFAIFLIAIVVILRLWGFEFATLTRGPLGGVLMAAGRVALILVLALAAIELSQLAIRHLFSRVAKRARTPRRAAQIRTLAPVLSGVSTTALVIAATMMALSEIGVEIGPLLAGAGIVGLAVGFGAQTLVKDFLTGIFLIVEDTVSIGDVARIGDASGVVEDMSLRTIKLRAFDGTLQVIPYGEAQIIFNMTKGFSFYVFELTISYTSDIGEALEQMKQTGDALQADGAFGPLILAPIEIVGVDKLTDAGVTLKARIKTQPGKQWTVGREYLKRIKHAFEANGVEVPVPTMKLAPSGPAA